MTDEQHAEIVRLLSLVAFSTASLAIGATKSEEEKESFMMVYAQMSGVVMTPKPTKEQTH